MSLFLHLWVNLVNSRPLRSVLVAAFMNSKESVNGCSFILHPLVFSSMKSRRLYLPPFYFW